MNVRELKELLSEFDDELEVQFAYNYGDHWQSRVTANVGSASVGHVKYSDYHSMDTLKRGRDDEDEDEENETTREVLILE
jgi:hypothetical protein